MKKTFIIQLLFLNLLFSGCENFLNINPKGEVVNEDLFTTYDGCEDALYGVYSSLGTNYSYGQYLSYKITDVLANTFKSDDLGLNYVGNYEHENASHYYDLIWQNMYSRIGYINNILIELEKHDESSFRYYKLYKGEALGLRAYLHFDLLRLFAVHIQSSSEKKQEAIPYVTTYNYSVTPFSSVQEVYDRVINDLKMAESLLAEDESLFMADRIEKGSSFIDTREIHFNLYAVQATLARVYWMKGDLNNAGLYAQKVINSEKFQLSEPYEIQSLVSGVLSFKETIWGVYSLDWSNTTYADFLMPNTVIVPSDDWEDLYDAGVNNGQDNRYNWFSYVLGEIKCSKITNQQLIENPQGYSRPEYQGINMIRIVEMYYILAESLLQENQGEARFYFDEVIASRGMVKYADREPEKNISLEDIVIERRREFIGEGQEWYNMKRLNLPVNMHGNEEPGSDAIYTLPIPIDEYDFRN